MKITRMIKVIALIMVVLTFCIFSCGGSDDDNTVADNIVNNNLTYTGTGTGITDSFVCLGGAVYFECSYTGESNFIVQLKEKSSGELEALLVNKIGDFSGSVSDNPAQGEYFLEVESSGDWTIKITGDIE